MSVGFGDAASGVVTPAEPQLEILVYQPSKPVFRAPLLFLHGAFVAAWCWEVHFLPYFVRHGFTVYAPSLRGHGRSAGGQQLQQTGIDEFVCDLERVVAGLEHPPVLIGHSMGGFVIQKYLERHTAPAVVLMASVPPSGLMQSSMRLMLADPLLLTQLTALQGIGPGAMDLSSAQRAVFSGQLPEAELLEYARHLQPESQRALWDMTVGALPCPWRMQTPPMLVIGAQDDALFSVAEVEQTARAYNADLHLQPDMGHAVMLELGWRSLAERVLDWLVAKRLVAPFEP
ncbi:alpha/beta hydrolase [Nitrococcus mobilis]|uniref:Predicted hydrolase or acyltransferase n=1 Tax=Nitrococcus mobilis Nb-231 TaxID=314278 RepID=A4BS62_9GAMM|nr:alpha/beta hydrolase [Nitrococcus mobilis]EAR21541.1 predicted hydrolase or acyltransferase [Nitrococcus mobilis Nb-231]